MINFRIKKPQFVLELSSSGVKKLTKDGKEIERTETKDMVNSNGVLDVNKFKKQVLPAIKSFWDNNKSGICIATALYRNIKNKEKICNLIKDEVGIDVNIISGKEEAILVGQAVKREWPNKRVLILDSGSMSTELSLIPDGWYKSFKKNESIFIDKEVLEDLLKDKNVLIVVTGIAMSKIKEPILDEPKKLRWHTTLQTILNKIGNHPVVGTNATPGIGLLV